MIEGRGAEQGGDAGLGCLDFCRDKRPRPDSRAESPGVSQICRATPIVA